MFRLKFDREVVLQDIDAELRFHFAESVESMMRAGASRSEAERETMRRFGDLSRYKSKIEKMGRKRATMNYGFALLDVVRQNLGSAVRAVKRSPGFTAAVVVTLGLGIGANATMFGVVDRLLLRPPNHVQDPDRVVKIFISRMGVSGERFANRTITHPDYKDLDSAKSFSATAAYSNRYAQTIGTGVDAERAVTVAASASLFPLLGVASVYGRFFTEEEDQRGQPGLAVLSYEYWRSRYDVDPGVLGVNLDVDGVSYTIVGVAPRGFTGAELRPVDIWLNLQARPGDWHQSRGWYFLRAIARVGPGVTVTEAQVEATSLHRNGRADSRQYDSEASVVLGSIIAANGPNAPTESAIARWLAGVSLVVLLIACANVANLLHARGVLARREIAVRIALGISRARLIGQLLTESVMFAGLGGMAGLLIAFWGGEFVRSILGSQVLWMESPVNQRVLVFTLVAAVVAGVVSGMVPAFQSSKDDVAAALKEGSKGSAHRSKIRSAMLVAQGALSLVLLVGAGLFVKSLAGVRSIDLGMDFGQVLAVELQRYDRAESATLPSEVETGVTPRDRDLLDRISRRLLSVPEVTHVTAARSMPFWSSFAIELSVPGWDSIPRLTTGGPYIRVVMKDYFAVMGLPVLRGRALEPSDHSIGASGAAVVNETMAKTLWPEGDALGQCLHVGGADHPCTEIVGVAKDSRREALIEAPTMQYFVPAELAIPSVGGEINYVLVRTAGDPMQLTETVRRAIQEVAPSIRYAYVRPLQEIVAPQFRSWNLGASMFTVFGLLALVVAALGMYSLLAFNVAQRTKEIGIRAALGATAGQIRSLVLRESARLTGIGVGVGIVIALFVSPYAQPLLYEVSPRDPWIFGSVTVILALVAVVAAIVPARKASGVDPNEALRME